MEAGGQIQQEQAQRRQHAPGRVEAELADGNQMAGHQRPQPQRRGEGRQDAGHRPVPHGPFRGLFQPVVADRVVVVVDDVDRAGHGQDVDQRRHRQQDGVDRPAAEEDRGQADSGSQQGDDRRPSTSDGCYGSRARRSPARRSPKAPPDGRACIRPRRRSPRCRPEVRPGGSRPRSACGRRPCRETTA